MKEKAKKSIRWIVLIICILIFLEIVENIFQNEIHQFDNMVYTSISQWVNPTITNMMLVITQFGSAICLIGICIIVAIWFKNKKYPLYMASNLLLIALTNQILKNVFNRPRPEGFRLIQETGYSFPSGHSMVSMAFYGLIIYFVYKKVNNRALKYTICIGLMLLILAIGISRIYLGVHYASDVVGGFCFSIAYLALFTNVISDHLEDKKL